MKYETPFEQDYWETLRVIFEARDLQAEVERALSNGKCPDHFRSIWNTHLRSEIVLAVQARLERAIETCTPTSENVRRIQDLIQAYRSWAEAEPVALLAQSSNWATQ